jgi:hypothetical protein
MPSTVSPFSVLTSSKRNVAGGEDQRAGRGEGVARGRPGGDLAMISHQAQQLPVPAAARHRGTDRTDGTSGTSGSDASPGSDFGRSGREGREQRRDRGRRFVKHMSVVQPFRRWDEKRGGLTSFDASSGAAASVIAYDSPCALAERIDQTVEGQMLTLRGALPSAREFVSTCGPAGSGVGTVAGGMSPRPSVSGESR